MNLTHLPNPSFRRVGFHYYPDTWHYRQADMETWLPRLSELGASWLTLLAPAERAIPEDFIRGLLAAKIQPVLHFDLHISQPAPVDTMRLLLGAYAGWGVRHVTFYERPNARASWPAPVWAQNYLVERFLDEFVPLALTAQEQGLTVITPPLEPGGDYWDLAFLRTALRALQRRGCTEMLESLALGAYAWINDRPLDWGAGGPERWPGARPYHPPADQQDQMGFRIFDWYLAICQQELGCRLPIYLLRAGQRLGTHSPAEQAAGFSHARQNLSAAQWIAGDPASDQAAGAVPDEVKACSFWLLAAEPGHANACESWYLPSGEHLPVVEAFRQWAAYMRQPHESVLAPAETGVTIRSEPESDEIICELASGTEIAPEEVVDGEDPTAAEKPEILGPKNQPIEPVAQPGHPISHYVLLPLYAWGAANWDLALVETLLQESHPAIGFSLAEARLAKRVTVVGAEGAVSAEALAMLRNSGCQVDRLMEDGTLIAT